MKKVLFLMFLLFLIVLGTANVKAQVRIGGNTPPNPAAALDLNAAEGTTTGTKGLALPRVTLGSSTAPLDGITANITGMLVYNTGGSLSTGVYYWNGSAWNRVDGALLGGDTIVGNEVIGPTTGGGLVRSGFGTTAAPYTLGIAPGGVTAAMLATGAANDADAVIGNEVTDATYGRGLVRAGSGTAVSPYTLGISPRGVDTSMLRLLQLDLSIPVSTTTGWRQMVWTRIMYSAPRMLPANTLRRDTADISSCLTQPQVTVFQTEKFVPVSMNVYQGTPFYVRTISDSAYQWGVEAHCFVLY